ncbi:hypothetical protein KR032_010550, partial [Drosophila birchii]
MKRFCWCLSLRIGCIIISFSTLFIGFLHMAEFFLWPNLLWGLLHLLASLCLSFSVLRLAVIPILIYALLEACYLIYALVYASVSYALKLNVYANLGTTYGILFWTYIV